MFLKNEHLLRVDCKLRLTFSDSGQRYSTPGGNLTKTYSQRLPIYKVSLHV